MTKARALSLMEPVNPGEIWLAQLGDPKSPALSRSFQTLAEAVRWVFDNWPVGPAEFRASIWFYSWRGGPYREVLRIDPEGVWKEKGLLT